MAYYDPDDITSVPMHVLQAAIPELNDVYTSGSGTSARSVASSSGSGSVGSSIASQGANFIDQLADITERNTARSEAQAAELRDWQERQNKIAMDFNSAEAAKNRDWQAMMSDTAHQREVADLRAAGLNPVLSAMGGNGAAVTSGATASGVTSSGAKGEVDTSLDGALVNLLGSMWSAQTQLEMQRNTAQNNMAIAEKQNATSELVAQIYTAQSREASQLAAATGLKQAEISAATQQITSRIMANASYYSSDVARQNAILDAEVREAVADMNLQGTIYQSDTSARNKLVDAFTSLVKTGVDFVGGQLSSVRSAQSAKDVAGQYTEAEKRGQDISTVNEVIRGLFGLGQSAIKSQR